MGPSFVGKARIGISDGSPTRSEPLADATKASPVAFRAKRSTLPNQEWVRYRHQWQGGTSPKFVFGFMNEELINANSTLPRIAMVSTHGYVAANPPLGAADTGGQV